MRRQDHQEKGSADHGPQARHLPNSKVDVQGPEPDLQQQDEGDLGATDIPEGEILQHEGPGEEGVVQCD